MIESIPLKSTISIFDMIFFYHAKDIYNEFHMLSKGWHLFCFSQDGLFISSGVTNRVCTGIELNKSQLLVKDEGEIYEI